MEFYNLSKMEQNFGRWNGQSVNLHQIKQRKSKQTFLVQLPAQQVNKRRLYKNKDKFKQILDLLIFRSRSRSDSWNSVNQISKGIDHHRSQIRKKNLCELKRTKSKLSLSKQASQQRRRMWARGCHQSQSSDIIIFPC